MAAVAPPPAPAPAPAAPAAADQATDLLQKISLDSQTKTQDATDATKKHGVVNSAQPLSVSIPSERSLTPLLQDFTDPNLFYLPAYYYGGYDGSMNEWDDYPRYVNPDGVEITPAVYGDIYHGYGYAPYGAYSAASSPVPTLGHDGQMFGPQHYQYPAAYYQPPTPAQAPNQAAATQGELPSSVAADKPPAQSDTAKPSSNGVANGTAHGNSGSVPLGSSHQNSALTHNGTYGRAPLLSGLPATGYLDSAYGFDGTGTHYRWFDAPAYQSGQHRPTTTSSVSSLALHNTNTSSARNQNKSPSPQPTGVHTRRPTSAMGAGVTAFSNRMYANARPYSQYGNSLKTGLAFGSNGYDSRVYGRWGLGIDNRYRPRGRGNGLYGFGNENQDGTVELNRGPRSGRFKNQKLFGHTVTIAVKGQALPSIENKNVSVVPDRAQFNRDDFPEQYADAKFFIIKSYSEDDIHKSIKYNFWASTTNGNKKLDAAYQEAQAKGSPCPIFLFFSVNTSGQFVGVAEMTGRVDFDNTLEYWQQDKWNGSFPVKWHIVKDVPNNILKHITLENNENKPVTNSRDTQEVNPEQGIQVLKIFKEHVSKTSILDDFGFYENRQKLMQEKRVKQQQLQKQVWDARTPDSITGGKEQDGVNGKPRLHEPLESISNLNKETTMVVGEMKVPAGNGVAPLPTYASKVAQTASEKPALANGVTKTG